MKRSYAVIIALILVVMLFFSRHMPNKRGEEIPELQPGFSYDTGQVYTSQEQKAEALAEICEIRENSITAAIQKVSPAVVSVNVIKTEIVNRYLNPFENPFFGFGFGNVPYKREVKGIGTGVIFTKDGYILTNSHVVEGATQIKVILPDERQFEAELIGLDSVHDIAVLKIDGKNLPRAELGASCGLIIGEWVIAVGNPYGFLLKDTKPSVSVGVISAINRDFTPNRDGKIYKSMIQTDAAINPGNSGGPLVNVLGQVIGINSFIFSESGGSIGIGFAIPIDSVKKLANELIKYGKIRDIWYGFKVQEITPVIAHYKGLNSTDGVLVAEIDNDGPADRGGLKIEDIITKINSYDIKNVSDAELAVSDVSVGDKIVMEILRSGKKMLLEIDAIEYK